MTASTCRKKYQIRENGFHKTENLSPPYGMKNSFKNTFPLDEIAFTRGVSEKWKKSTPASQKISFQEQD